MKEKHYVGKENKDLGLHFKQLGSSVAYKIRNNLSNNKNFNITIRELFEIYKLIYDIIHFNAMYGKARFI